jgi:gas vesicle protein
MSFLNRVFSASAVSLAKPTDENVQEPHLTTAVNGGPVSSSGSSIFDMASTSYIQPWMREIRPSGPRQSRASSIISTQTKYSTNTLQDDARSIDARSIDIHVGGQTFRIARDGSRITDAPPPPYSGPINALPDGRPRASSQSRALPSPQRASLREGSTFRGGRPGGSSTFDYYYGDSDDDSNGTGAETPRQQSRAASPTSRHSTSIRTPSETELTPTVTENGSLGVPGDGSDTPSRNWSYKAGPDNITVVSDGRKFRSVSQNDLPLIGGRHVAPLRRWNRGVRLPTLVTEAVGEGSSSRDWFGKAVATSPQQTHSAGAVLYTDHSIEPQSPTFIGRNAQGVFPRNGKARQESLSTHMEDGEEETSSTSAAAMPDSDSEERSPPPMDTENDISLHYARLMRRLDRDHRRTLHSKDKELEKLRERLNEMDIVYRQQLKSRDFVIDDLKKRLDSLQDKTENMVEQARNEVEDLWERRWKEQSGKLMERMKRIEEDSQKTIDRLKAERGHSGEQGAEIFALR